LVLSFELNGSLDQLQTLDNDDGDYDFLNKTCRKVLHTKLGRVFQYCYSAFR